MASTYEIEVKFSLAKNQKNINWQNGPNHPYVVIWVDPTQKYSTSVAQCTDSNWVWDEKLVIHVPPATTIDNTRLYIDVVYANTEPNDRALVIGSAQLRLVEIGVGECVRSTLSLMRPSGRPQGTVEVEVILRDTGYRALHGASDARAYGISPSPIQPLPTTRYGAPPILAYSVLTPIQYNAQQNYGYGQIGQGSCGFGMTIIGFGPIAFGSGPIVFGSELVSYGTFARIVSYGGGQALNVITTNGRRSNCGSQTRLLVGNASEAIGAITIESFIDNPWDEEEIIDRAASKVESESEVESDTDDRN